MTCEEARLALSVRLDGERQPGGEPDEHLVGCVACRDWLASAELLTRMVRARPIEVPDLAGPVLAAVAADREVRTRVAQPAVVGRASTVGRAGSGAYGRQQVLRLAVGLAAVAQLVLAVPVLLGTAGVVPDPHATREMASFGVALAVGFALAAYRPHRVRAYLPVAFVLAACLAGTSAADLAGGHTIPVHEVGHLAAVVQAGLLWGLGRAYGGSPPAPSGGRGIAAAGPAG